MTIILNESGYDTGQSFEDYAEEAAQYGDDPRDWSDDIDDFAFVSVEYAKQDPHWQDDAETAESMGWPEHLPLWSYRPQ